MTKKQYTRLAIPNKFANFLKANKILDSFVFFIMHNKTSEDIKSNADNELYFRNIFEDEFQTTESVNINYNNSIRNGLLKNLKK